MQNGRPKNARFDDGVEFDTTGPLRVERHSDGLYVLGDGMLIAVDSYDEAEEAIADLSQDEGRSKPKSK